MSNELPPFMNAYGLLKKILEKIKKAQTPPRFTQDFLKSKLGFSGGSANAFIPLSKRLGLLTSEGNPTDLYRQFRNETSSKLAMAKCMKIGYSDLFERDEYVNNLDSNKLEGLLLEATGLEKKSGTLNAIKKTFENLKEYADFEEVEETEGVDKPEDMPPKPPVPPGEDDGSISWNLSYTINLVLPKSENIDVFNAIFKSLKENMLKK